MAKTPFNWQSEWGEYIPSVNDFTTKILELSTAGNNAAAAVVEGMRNTYINSDSYTGSQKTTNIFGSVADVASAASNTAEKVVEKITEPAKAAAAAADQSAEKQTETKVIYSSFDPSGYATITPEVASDTGGKILGYGIIAVIGLVILDKLFA